MTKRHDDIFDAVLSGVPQKPDRKYEKERAGARFLKRGNAISEKLSGQNEEKTLHWVELRAFDPRVVRSSQRLYAVCRAGHMTTKSSAARVAILR